MGKFCQFCKNKTFWNGCYNPHCEGGSRFEPIVTPEKFAEDMIKIKNHYEDDAELVHFAMDKTMIDLLKDLGYEHGVKVFIDTPNKRWA